MEDELYKVGENVYNDSCQNVLKNEEITSQVAKPVFSS